MKALLLIVTIILLFQTANIPPWSPQTSGTTARLRGISVVTDKVAWASGANSTVLRTNNGGSSWKKLVVTSDQLDFRDIDAVDENTAYVLSIGNGPASRIYKTSDAGKSWTMQFKNEDPKVFLDAMSFWDKQRGLAFGDSVNGQFYILITEDGGRNWKRVPTDRLPPALENEGAFAASGSNVAVFGKRHAWIGTGAAARSRVLRTSDGGQTWAIVETPLNAGPSAGIFSIAFRDDKHGIVVGGDYRKEGEAFDNAAVTDDGGVTWKLVRGLAGYRSAVAYQPNSRTVIAAGPSGCDISSDNGATWTQIAGVGFDTIDFSPANSKSTSGAWAAGTDGRISKFSLQ
jgi:photosystem II stability/assembly factor-like uncharacterized protein